MLPFMVRFGELPLEAAFPIFLLFIGFHGLVFGIFAWLLCYLRREISISVMWLAGLCWVSCEFVFPCIFPWYYALSQVKLPIILQIADITGPTGVSFLLALCSGALFDIASAFVRKKQLRSMPLNFLPGLFLIAFAVIYGGIRLYQIDHTRKQAPKVKVGIVQPNVGMDIKFLARREEQLKKLQDASVLLASQGADLIVWPESSYPRTLPRPPTLPYPLKSLFSENNPWWPQKDFSVPLLFGAMTKDATGVYNTALMLDKDGNLVGTFDKNFLLIFGEYVPFWEQFKWIKEFIPNVFNTNAGKVTTTFPFEFQGKVYSLGPLICYEEIIPSFGRRLFNRNPAPNLMINITNDAWFGQTAEPYEHLGLSVFRSIEHRVDLIRVTNTGVSSFIDAAGRVYNQTPSFDPKGAHVPAVSVLETATLLTPGGFYQKLGDLFAIVCLITVLIFGVLARHRSGRPIQVLAILGSALFLHGCVFLISVFAPRTSMAATYAALFHMQEASFNQAHLFQSTWLLLTGLSLASLGLGVFLTWFKRRRSPKQASSARPNLRAEIIAALLSVTTLPVVLVGQMEGNTGAVVILTLVCVLLAILGEKVTLWIFRKG